METSTSQLNGLVNNDGSTSINTITRFNKAVYDARSSVGTSSYGVGPSFEVETEVTSAQLLMSHSTMHAMETAVQAGILPVVVLCGVVMNAINMSVFLRQGLSDRINVCLFRWVSVQC